MMMATLAGRDISRSSWVPEGRREGAILRSPGPRRPREAYRAALMGPIVEDVDVQLHPDLVAALDLPGALARLESQRGGFLPSSLASRAAVKAAGDFLPRLQVRMQAGIDLQPADIVFAHRYSSGTRPVSDLSIEARLVVEALAKRLVDRLATDADLLGLAPHIAPAQGQKMHFERWPLEAPRPAYVAMADVASFYEYVDHDLLANEIVELTGDPRLAEAINSTLSDLLRRRFGLPQGPQGSDVFATVYLSRVDRLLLRAGVAVERFNDDYLLKAESVARARRDLAALERSLRDLGLILNHEKTQVLTADQYEDGLSAYQELLEAAAIDTVELPPGYTFDPEAFEDISLENADEETIEAAFERALDDEEHPFPARQRMIDTALPYLAAFENLKPLERIDVLVETWPAHIRNVNLYMRHLIGTEHERHETRRRASLRRDHRAVPQTASAASCQGGFPRSSRRRGAGPADGFRRPRCARADARDRPLARTHAGHRLICDAR